MGLKMDDIEQTLADILKEEIDREIMINISVSRLISYGWTLVTINPTADLNGIDAWMQANIKEDWRLFEGQAVFLDPNDAVLFKLTWS